MPMAGESSNRSKPVFCEYGVYESPGPGKQDHISAEVAIRDWDWKLLMRLDGSEIKLFNLADDPKEKSILLAKNPETVHQMKKQLGARWSQMDSCYKGDEQ